MGAGFRGEGERARPHLRLPAADLTAEGCGRSKGRRPIDDEGEGRGGALSSLLAAAALLRAASAASACCCRRGAEGASEIRSGLLPLRGNELPGAAAESLEARRVSLPPRCCRRDHTCGREQT